ncbi:hypothetical protein GQ53DRAFT_741421 [Thozetella sp. PMI_491]|nr:hypothetical protein GQ53DRAFT_741421 [Thozetella sp. PMI_491]
MAPNEAKQRKVRQRHGNCESYLPNWRSQRVIRNNPNSSRLHHSRPPRKSRSWKRVNGSPGSTGTRRFAMVRKVRSPHICGGGARDGSMCENGCMAPLGPLSGVMSPFRGSEGHAMKCHQLGWKYGNKRGENIVRLARGGVISDRVPENASQRARLISRPM